MLTIRRTASQAAARAQGRQSGALARIVRRLRFREARGSSSTRSSSENGRKDPGTFLI
jgi:hypothetical protein